MSIAATITTSIASSSGSRTCLVCSERITDRTMIVEFRTQDKRTDITLHLFCAGQLWNALDAKVNKEKKVGTL